MCGINKERKKEQNQQIQTENLQQEGQMAEADVQMEPVQQQENIGQEITEMLPMQAVPFPMALQRVAEPIPEQPVPAGKLTYKQRRDLKKKDKLARKITPYGDHVSLVIKEQVDQVQTLFHDDQITRARDNSDAPDKSAIPDGRMLKNFLQGYKTDRNGEPLNEQETAAKQADDRFLADYCSCELQRRREHLERIKNEMLTIRVSQDMLTESYLEKHAAEVYRLVGKMTYFENMQRDPINEPYFDALPAYEKKLLDYRVRDVCGSFAVCWKDTLVSKGLNTGKEGVRYETDPDQYDKFAGELQEKKIKLANDLEQSEQKEEALRAEYQQQQQEALQQKVADIIPQADLSNELGGNTEYEALRKLYFDIPVKNEKKQFPNRMAQVDSIYETRQIDGKEQPESEREAQALVAINLRISSSEEAKAAKSLRGQFFDPMQGQVVKLFADMSRAGVDFKTINTIAKAVSVNETSAAKYASGGGIEVIEGKMLGLFEQYVSDQKGQEYIRQMYSILGNAKVFRNNKELFVNFIMQGLLNTHCNHAQFKAEAFPGENYDNILETGKKVTFTMLALPRLVRQTGEKWNNLPESTKNLTNRYRDIVKRVTRETFGED